MFNLNQKTNARNSLLALGITAFGLLMMPNSAQAMTLVNNTNFTDTDFNSLIDSGKFSELFVAEGRIGDRGTKATYELSINDDVQKGAKPVTQEQFNWGNDEKYDFSLEYDGSMVNYILGGETLSTQEFNGPINSIFLRTSAGEKTTTSLTNLVFNGTAIGQDLISSESSRRDIDYLQLNDVSSPFKITGKASIRWETNNNKPNTKNSLNAFQIKVGNSPSPTSVPEPGTIGAIFITGMAGFALKKKK